MLTADLGHKTINLLAFDDACHEVPSGAKVWEGRRERFDLEELRCYRSLKDTKRIARSLGTLGGGNHFIEIDVASDGMQMVLRKGAIAAHAGETVLIPLNMRDGSIIAMGRGNEEWNNSAPHGAGRVLSRSTAKEVLSLEAYQDDMKGIYSTSVCEATIDEAPAAYKPVEDIIGPIADAVEIVDVMKPIYNFKAS